MDQKMIDEYAHYAKPPMPKKEKKIKMHVKKEFKEDPLPDQKPNKENSPGNVIKIQQQPQDVVTKKEASPELKHVKLSFGSDPEEETAIDLRSMTSRGRNIERTRPLV